MAGKTAAANERREALARFADLLRRYRENLGHDNPHAFFTAQGGRAFFGCTYRAYLSVEKGLSLPQPALVEKLISTLWVAVDDPKARDFAAAYLRLLVGSEDCARSIVEGLSTGPEKAASGADESETVLSPEQARLLYDDEKRYWCFTLLSNDAGSWDARALAEALGWPAPAVAKALKALEAAGLARRGKDGRWRSPFGGKLLFHSKDRPYRPQDLAAMRSHWRRMAESRAGEVIQEHPVLTRCSKGELMQYFPYLMNSLLAADRLSRVKSGPDTGFFLLELKAEELLPF